MLCRYVSLLVAFLAIISYVVTSEDGGNGLACSIDSDCDTLGATCVNGTCSCLAGEIMTGDLTQCLPAALGLGAPCEDDVQCSARLLVGGRCDGSSQTCQCAEGYHYLRGRCWFTAGLGESCGRDESCYVNYDSDSSVCSEGTCNCADGYYQREYSSCRRKSTSLGDECGITQDCYVEEAVCSNKTCTCPSGWKPNADKGCVPLETRYLDQWEITDEDYQDSLSNLQQLESIPRYISAGSKWKYTGESTFSEELKAYTLKADTSCNSDEDCRAPHTVCQSRKCVCQRGFYSLPNSDQCHPELYAACETDSECQMKYSLCRNNSCSCKVGFTPSADRKICRKMSREIGWSCLHREQCGYFGPGAVCEKKKCRCGPGTHYSKPNNYCWISKGLGEICLNEEDCMGLGGAACTEETASTTLPTTTAAKRRRRLRLKASAEDLLAAAEKSEVSRACRCVPGFHSSQDGLHCREDAIGVGSECVEDLDCITVNTVCGKDGKCECKLGYLPDKNTTCLPGIGGLCQSDSECTVQPSNCQRGVCTCSAGYVSTQSGDKCLPVTNTFGGSCWEDVQCETMAGICEAGKCECESKQHFRDGLCRERRNIGMNCTRTSECYLEKDSHRSECRNGLCQCRYEYTIPGRNFCSDSGASSFYSSALILALSVILSCIKI